MLLVFCRTFLPEVDKCVNDAQGLGLLFKRYVSNSYTGTINISPPLQHFQTNQELKQQLSPSDYNYYYSINIAHTFGDARTASVYVASFGIKSGQSRELALMYVLLGIVLKLFTES